MKKTLGKKKTSRLSMERDAENMSKLVNLLDKNTDKLLAGLKEMFQPISAPQYPAPAPYHYAGWPSHPPNIYGHHSH